MVGWLVQEISNDELNEKKTQRLRYLRLFTLPEYLKSFTRRIYTALRKSPPGEQKRHVYSTYLDLAGSVEVL